MISLKRNKHDTLSETIITKHQNFSTITQPAVNKKKKGFETGFKGI